MAAMNRRHKGDTATFRELTNADKTRSISGTIRQLEQAIRARSRQSSNPQRVIDVSAGQIERLLRRLQPGA
jgi:hypothetical protein